MIITLERKPKDAVAPNAFTLTELLVVIAIIGVLAALLLSSLSAAKSYSRSAACINHLRQMGIALKMYVDDHNSTFPFYLGSTGPSYGDAKGGPASDLVYWSSKLFPYYPLNWTNSLFHCPGYKGINTGPFLKGNVNRLGSYGYNKWGSAISGRQFIKEDFGLGPDVYWKVPPVSESQIAVPSEMLSIAESRFVPGYQGGLDALFCGNFPVPARHGKKYNQLLCDGHVSSMSPRLLFNPTNTASMWNYDHQPHPELW
jgi:prepilin-type N-terminal cleavage/methylation domain-containing protein/prepilin-type processing-associated H-X9-DG protein